ncbi:MAG: GNAT family N-acetyltransferase [Planctomycetia bacterium]|nr:GNAT family N-acetyltransferase [Planctomycetia bacterium]
MAEVRTFRKGDEEAIVGLWNRRVAGCHATGPLTEEEFAESVLAKHYFDPEGLVLALEGSRPVAFVHAGFRSADWIGPDFARGTISMVAVEENCLDVGAAAVAEAIRYLFRRGAKQVEAFTIAFPNQPFYNCLYGGELAGMDEEHPCGMALMKRCRFNISSSTLIMVADLRDGPPPPTTFNDLQLRVGPEKSKVLGLDPLACYGIPERIRRASLFDSEGVDKAGVTFWHLERYNRASGKRLAAISNVGVAEELRGSGAGEVVMREAHRILFSEGARETCLGVGATNGRAVGFYRKVGCRPLKAAYTFHLDWRHYGEYR